MDSASQSREFILEWNLRFRWDRKWRKKYKIPFGSKEHLAMNQIDIYLDILEDIEFEKLEKRFIDLELNKEDFKKTGKFLKEQKLTAKQEDEVVDLLRSSIKKNR